MSHLIRLYKYISFDSGFWKQVLNSNCLYFSNRDELWSINDQKELSAEWIPVSALTTDQFFFPIRKNFEFIFNNARVLCLSRKLSKHCWQNFSKGNGYILQFNFNQRIANQNQITHNFVRYKEKNLNFPSYFITNVTETRIQDLVSRSNITKEEGLEFLGWSREADLGAIFQRFILDQIIFKKEISFVNEAEFRFVHPAKSSPNQIIKTPFHDGFQLSFNELGLKLLAIYTNNSLAISEHTNETNLIKNLPIRIY